MAKTGLVAICFQANLEREANPEHPYCLLGDQAYASSDFMLTPIREDRVTGGKEADYNRR